MAVRQSDTAFRVRRKTNTTADDPDWHGTQTDPRDLRVTLASSETGDYVITLTPEDDTIDPLEIEYSGTGGDEPTAADGLADRADVLAAAKPGWDFLRSDSRNASAVLILAVHPKAPLHTPSFDPPGSATMTPDHVGVMPIVAWGEGVGNLAIEVYACDGDDVLAPGSGTVDLQLLQVADRIQPQGKDGPQNDTAAPAVALLRSATAHALNTPWVVPCPKGWFTVRISGDASMPAGIDALEAWVDKTDAPVSVVYSEDIAPGAVGTDELADDAVTTAKIAADAVTGAEVADDAIDSEHIAAGAVDVDHVSFGAVRTVAADGAVALVAADAFGVVHFSSTSGGSPVVMTRSTLTAGRPVILTMTAFDTNAYTMAVDTGTLTFNAADESATVYWDGTAMRVAALNGATVV
jgi:hypothetical protein